MNRLNAIVRSLDSRMNPIVVKELRQTSRGKFLIVILLGFLFLQLTVTGVVSFFTTSATSPGPTLFMSLFGVLTTASGLLIPAYAGFRLAQERADANVDLLFSTALKPASIIWGKTLSSAIIATLIYSVCMPFIVMTYLLRGIDLPSAFLLTAISYFIVLLTTQGGILIGCMPANRVVKGIVGLFALFTIFMSLVNGMGFFVFQNLFSGSDLMTQLMSQRGLWTAFGLFALCIILGIGFFLLSTAFISPASSNRAFIPRVYLTAVWLFSLAVVVVWSEIVGWTDPIIGWMTAMVLVFGWALGISVSERDRVGLRVRQKIPLSGVGRVFAFLFYSGSTGGFIWSSIGVVLTLLIGTLFATLWGGLGGSEMEKILYRLTFTACSSWISVLGAVLIHRKLLKNRISNVYTWLIAYGIATVGGLLWVVYLIGANVGGFGGMMTGGAADTENFPSVAAGIAALVLCLICLPWMARQIAAFKPYSRSTPAPQE